MPTAKAGREGAIAAGRGGPYRSVGATSGLLARVGVPADLDAVGVGVDARLDREVETAFDHITRIDRDVVWRVRGNDRAIGRARGCWCFCRARRRRDRAESLA